MRASALIVSSLCWLRAIAADPSPAVVCDVRVISPHVADVSSLAAWRASTITPEMSPQQQAEAVFATVVGFVHHEWYVREWLGGPEACVHDPIKTFNVYGYGHCCCTAAHVAALARSLGMPARGCSTPGHTLAEVSYDGAWHMLDPAFIDYFPRADGVIASVDELTAGISAWLAGHPEMADPEAQRRFMRGGGWRSGPAILTHGRFLDDNGWLPERGHGWYSMLRQFGDPAQVRVYENGTTVGYRVDNRLRHGERLILPWANRGMFLNDREGDACDSLSAVPGEGGMAYAREFGDLTRGRVGNGERIYRPLADRELPRSASAFANLRFDAAASTIAAADPSRPATLIVRMPSSYVYLTGSLTTGVALAGGAASVRGSDDHGRTWRPLGDLREGQCTIDLTSLARRRYDYRIAFDLTGGATISDIVIRHDTQHAQRALPALARGDNRVRFAGASDEGTITIEGALDPAAALGRQVSLADLGATAVGLEWPNLRPTTGAGHVDIPIGTPGDLRRIRVSAHYRARDARDGYALSISFDGGATFGPAGEFSGPHAGMSAALAIDAVPAGARQAILRLSGRQVDASMLFALRVDADYAEPGAGFAPVLVRYAWLEDGVERSDEHVVRQPGESWTIRCHAQPVMREIAFSIAP